MRRLPYTEGLSDLDVRVFEAIAHAPSPLLDATMRPLSASADHGRLWFVLAGGMALTRRTDLQRAAVRGVVTLGAASLLANQVGKRLYPRRRPNASRITVERLRRQPMSSSFPSGHSASAAAFATAVATENRPVGFALGLLAGAVGLSRITTGAHYPGDVLGGFLLGSGLAVLGARLVPPVDENMLIVAPPSPAVEPPRPDGAGVTVLVNPTSGDGTGARVLDHITQALPAARIVEVTDVDDLPRLAAEAAETSDVLGVAGGDGTVACVARYALAAGLPLAVFPAGTFNHFAKDVGTDTAEATVAAVRDGRAAQVDVLLLNEETVILNTASIGAYPEFVRMRERYENSLRKPVAAIRAALHVLRHSSPVTVTMNGAEVSTLFFFLGNGRYGAPGLFPGRRSRLDDGLIDVRYLTTGHRFETLRLAASLLSGRIRNSRLYQEAQVPEFAIASVEPIRVAHDGEAGEPTTRADFRLAYRSLRVFGTAKVAR